MKINLNDLFNLQSAVIYNPDKFHSSSHITIDSRTVKSGSIFIAIKGSNFDGHDFVKEAVMKGASTVIINKKMLHRFDSVNCTIITVDDTIKTLGDIANTFRKKLNAKIISITGSNGKTSTKEILAHLLSQKYNVTKTVSNNNNHIGVPLTLLQANDKTDFIVLEHGTNHFNEIFYTAKIAEPDYGLITNIGNSHLEYLINKQGVFNEKKSLLDEVIENEGIIFINDEDKYLRTYNKNYKRRITFGFKKPSNVNAQILSYTIEGKTKVKINFPKYSLEVALPLYGEINVKNILAAVSVAYYLGLSKKDLIRGINSLEQTKGRLEVSQVDNFILVNDTYNANPESMKSAFSLLTKIKLFKKKILVLGDMFELGKQAKELHLELSSQILRLKPEFVFTIGRNMKYLSNELKGKNLKVKHFSNREFMKLFLEKQDFSNSVILVKGSRGMKMEEMIQPIIKGMF